MYQKKGVYESEDRDANSINYMCSASDVRGYCREGLAGQADFCSYGLGVFSGTCTYFAFYVRRNNMNIVILILVFVALFSSWGWFRRYVNVLTLVEYMKSAKCLPPDEKTLKECEEIALREILRKIMLFKQSEE